MAGINYHIVTLSNPCHDERGRFCSTGGGSISAETRAIMEKYKGQQADHLIIKEYMESIGLTKEDYLKANEALYAHNVASGKQSDERLSKLWHSDNPEGKALRAMSQWNEWQVQNGPGAEHRKENAPTWDYAKQVVARGGDWKMFQGADASGSVERFKQYMEATSRGEAIFYRKGGLDHAAVSTTTNQSGARSGSSLFRPDHWFSFGEMKAAGYYLLSGARGMVGVTSAQEREHIWLKPLSPQTLSEHTPQSNYHILERVGQVGTMSNPCHNPAGPGGGQFCGSESGSSAGVSWKPVMSKAEAEKFIEGSKYTKEVFHVTRAGNVSSIKDKGFDLERVAFGRMWGNGVYVGMDKGTIDIYKGQGTKTMKLKVKVDNPFTVSSPEQMNKIIKDWKLSDMAFKERVGLGEVLAIKLKGMGHDSFIMKFKTPSALHGGNQIVVFDPKKVVILQ